jgi:hypothetical protein
MIFYNVTVTIKKDVEAEWLEWMKNLHIPDVIRTGFFNNFKLCKIIDPPPKSDEAAFTISYSCESIDLYLAYAGKEAPRLQAEHKNKFGNLFTASRTIIEEI